MATPAPHAGFDAPHIALDNGCFSKKWSADTWKAWLSRQTVDPLFAVVPDVVGDSYLTRQLWDQYCPVVCGLGYRAAFVLQDGATEVPWEECGAVFVGGTTEFKLSETARKLVAEAKKRALWVHMGRVNSFRRMQIARDWGCDSVDGTFIRFGPDVNTPRLLRMLNQLHANPSLLELEQFGTADAC